MYDKILKTPLLILVQGDIIKIKKKWSLVESLKKDAFGIALRENGILKTDTKEKANICKRQFESVFTGEGDSDPPSKGASPFSPMGYITVDPKGIAKLLDELYVLFFSSKFQNRTPWCNDQNMIVSVLYERKKSWDPHVFEMLQAQDLLVLFVHFCDTGCYLIKRGSMREINT